MIIVYSPGNSKFFLLQYPIQTCSGKLDMITTCCDRKVTFSAPTMPGLLVQDGFAITGGKTISRHVKLLVIWLQKDRERGSLSVGVCCLSRKAFAILFPSQREMSKTVVTKRNSPHPPAGRFFHPHTWFSDKQSLALNL